MRATLQLDRQVHNIFLDCRIFAVDGTSVVGERELSFVDGSGEPILLSMSQNVKNIVGHGSRKDSGFLEETEVNFTHFRSTRVCRSWSTINLRKKEIQSRRASSEFHSLSIVGIVEIIIERGSRKDRYLVEERDVNFTYFQLTRLPRSSRRWI